MPTIELYDSTLRDGGYINNWNFTIEKIQAIYNAANDAGISYVEVGYTDKVDISKIKKKDAKVFVMMDYKNKQPIQSGTDGVRVAFHKTEWKEAVKYAKRLKCDGLLVALQIMAVSTYSKTELDELSENLNGIDIVTLADSNGSFITSDIEKLISRFTKKSYKLNVHFHNNLQLALSNTLAAINYGADMIDCTFNGIGRGSGNLPTELIIVYLNEHYQQSFCINPILEAIDKYITPMKSGYSWGYNITNMLSGVHNLHPYYGRDVNKYDSNKANSILNEIKLKNIGKYIGKKKIVGVIPSRFESTRFLGKPLKLINGKSLLERVYNNLMKVGLIDEVIVATDDKRIEKLCIDCNMRCMMTPKECKSGTDRVYEISKTIDADIYINLQGDEPLILPETITLFIDSILQYGELDRVAYDAITDCEGEDIENINVPKVAINVYGDLLYMSRLPIPYIKDGYKPKYYKELGLHGYTKKGLEWFDLHKEQFNSEKSEGLEFLRFLETGKYVRTVYAKLPFKNHAIDVPDDVRIVENIMKENGVI